MKLGIDLGGTKIEKSMGTLPFIRPKNLEFEKAAALRDVLK